MKVELHDLIGNHSGCYLYLESFSKLLEKKGVSTEICSNYSSEVSRQIYPNFFKGYKILKILGLIRASFLFAKNVLRNGNSKTIVLSSYGNFTDIPFLLISKLSPKTVIIDLHEAIGLGQKFKVRKFLFKLLYPLLRNLAIVHSEKAKNILLDNNYKGEILLLPHINYSIELDYKEKNLGVDLRDLTSKKKKYFLFFGNLLASKGVEDLFDAMAECEGRTERFKLIVAGRDSEHCVENYLKLAPGQNINFLLRYFNDDEMKFLFDMSDVIIMPYRNIYQSGVLEMAITYRKPILASQIPYFASLISKYPSFGDVVDSKNPKVFAQKLVDLSYEDLGNTSFNDDEVKAYLNKDGYQNLVDRLFARFEAMS